MKPIKYAILLLVALVVFSGTVEAKVISRTTTGSKRTSDRLRRDKERREEREREQRKKAVEKYKERQAKLAEARKKRIASAEAVEKEQRDKANEARQKKVQEEIAAEKTAREEKALLGEYETMAREVNMSSTQRDKLVAMVRKFRGLPPGTSRDNSGEIASLTKAYESATGEKKKIIAAKLKAAQKKNADPPKSSKSPKSSTTSKADQHKQIMGLLTPAQKLKWGGYKLAHDPSLKFEGITLTDEQIKRIRTLCDAVAKDLPDEAGDVAPAVAAKTRLSVLKKVRIQIIYTVLTPAQRAVAK